MSHATILLVDDDDELRKAISQSLVREGYEVLQHPRATDAMDYLLKAEKLPDMVITDLCMPGADGMTFLRMANSTFYQLPIMVITALNQEEHHREAVGEGAAAFLRKPFDKKSLIRTVEQVLKDARTKPISLKKKPQS